MSINLKKIITATMATGMLLGIAGGVNGSMVQNHITANASSRVMHHYHHSSHRSYHHYSHYSHHSYRSYHHYSSRRAPKRAPKKRARAKKANAQPANQINAIKRQDSFVMLKYSPSNARQFQNEASQLSRAHVAYGAYMENVGRIAWRAKQMMKKAPKAAFYMDAQASGSAANGKARTFADTVRSANKPMIFYAGNKQTSRTLKNGTRQQFDYQWTSDSNHSGSNIWQFPKSYNNNRISKAISGHLLNNTMPLEFKATSHYIEPTSGITVSALQQAMAGNLDNASRLAESAAMQQWQHNYENYTDNGPSANVNKLVKNTNRHSMKYYRRKATKRFNRMNKRMRIGAAKGTKRARGKKKAQGKSSPYTTNQMIRAYTSMQTSLNHGYNGTHAPEACEAISTDMGLHLMGKNRHKKVYYWLKYHMPKNANPEKGYTHNPLGHHKGTTIYPEALRRVARANGAKNSWILADNAYWKGYGKNRNYLIQTPKKTSKKALKNNEEGYFGWHNNRRHQYQGKLKKSIFTKTIVQQLSEGHPIVIEADHDMHNIQGDHIILLWGYKNGQYYWVDPNDSPKRVPNAGGHVSLGQLMYHMNARNHGPRAVVLDN